MIDLNDNDDPLLFAADVGHGKLIFQYTEVVAALGGLVKDQPEVADVVRAMRKASRTPEIAAETPDEKLFALFVRVAKLVEKQGNA
jgi:hypothetical protein